MGINIKIFKIWRLYVDIASQGVSPLNPSLLVKNVNCEECDQFASIRPDPNSDYKPLEPLKY